MTRPNETSPFAEIVANVELRKFRTLTALHDHWRRANARPAYYWYLTFPDEVRLHELTLRCQRAINFPYYDLTDIRDLHMTLDRVAFEGSVSADELQVLIRRANDECASLAPFKIHVGGLGGTAGAIGFSASRRASSRTL